MRLLGHLRSEASAFVLSDYLYVQGIKNEVEAEQDGTWALWVLEEEELQKALSVFSDFRLAPEDPRFKGKSSRAKQLKERELAEDEEAKKRMFDRTKVFAAKNRRGRVTLILIGLSLVVALLSALGEDPQIFDWLFIKMPEVRNGQVWRLLTPIFIHFTALHLFFNLWWLFDLGNLIETRQGSMRLLLLVVVIGICSNVGQYHDTGFSFGGMSGVVYGLFGYCWMRGKHDPESGLELHPQTVIIMIVWFFICLGNVFGGRTANVTHGVGLIMGSAWGYLSSLPSLRGKL